MSWVMTQKGELVNLDNGNIIRSDRGKVTLYTADNDIRIGEYDNADEQIKNLASKMGVLRME